jgi:uncharacterized protein YukE
MDMNLKFDMGSNTLTQLTRQTSGSSDDLGALVKDLARAAEPLQGRFEGAAKATFDRFHAHSGEIADNLNRALGSVLAGIASQNTAFIEGEQQMSDDTRAAMSAVSYDAGRFGGK